ncbi:MAG: ABC transporter substrate-binding protein [Xanthobacteraceae bacterium]|jgi:NitT/TauT family transport system substrate-binding protein
MISFKVVTAATMLGMAVVPSLIPRAHAEDKVTFALNWIPAGNHFGVFAAQDQGFYKDAGLDVDIQRGYGSGDTVKRVATGSADFGIGDAASVVVGRSNGLAVKQVATIFDKAADAIFFVEGNGIAKPADLQGRTMGATAGETTATLFPRFAANAGIDPAKVTILNLSPSAKYASLVSKSVDSIVGFVNEEPVIAQAAEKTGMKINKFTFADYGIDYYSIGIIVGDQTIATKPDLVKRFVEATMKGYAWTIQHPDTAAAGFTKHFPESNGALALQQWYVAKDLILTDRTRSHGLGWISPEKMQETLDLTRSISTVAGNVRIDDIYTDALLTKVAVP